MQIGPIIIHQGTSTPWYITWGIPFLAASLTLIAGIVGELVRRRIFRPTLSIVDFNGAPAWIQDAKVKGHHPGYHDSRYVKVAVTNKKKVVARDCRAYLTRMFKLPENGKHGEELLSESLRLCWAFEGTTDEIKDNKLHRGIDIPTGVTVNFDVCSSKRENFRNAATMQPEQSDDRKIEFASPSVRYSPMFDGLLCLNNGYRIELMVTCDGGNPLNVAVKVKFGESWDSIEVIPD